MHIHFFSRCDEVFEKKWHEKRIIIDYFVDEWIFFKACTYAFAWVSLGFFCKCIFAWFFSTLSYLLYIFITNLTKYYIECKWFLLIKKQPSRPPGSVWWLGNIYFLKKKFQWPQLSVIFFNENCFRNVFPLCPLLLKKFSWKIKGTTSNVQLHYIVTITRPGAGREQGGKLRAVIIFPSIIFKTIWLIEF